MNPATAIMPMVFVLCVSLLREGVEDYFRWKSDEEQNNLKVELLNVKTRKLEEKSAWEIKIGDVVKLEDKTIFPADFVLLSSSSAGEAFIKTSSLDGEKNLKKRVQMRDFEDVVINDDESKAL